MSGLLTWAAVTALASSHPIGQLEPETWIIGAVMCSGAALLPDLDHPQSTVSRTFGPVTQGLSNGVNALSGFVYRTTRTKRDPKRDGGHRGLTHTLVFALVVTVLTTAVVQTSQHWALPAVMFFFSGLAVRGLMHEWHPKRDALLITVVSFILTVLCLRWIDRGDDMQAAAMGIAVGLGCVAHYLGDAITEQGCPMLWPVPIGGKTWYPVAPPKPMRMQTGGKVEMTIIGPGLTVLAIWLSAAALQQAGALPFLFGVSLLPWR